MEFGVFVSYSYTSPQDPDYVDYVEFSDYVESIFTLKRKSF